MTNEDIGPAFRKVLHDNLVKMGWSEEKIKKGIEVIGRDVLSAARLAEPWQRKFGDRAVGLLEEILGKSTTFKELQDALRGHGLDRTFRGKEALQSCRGMLFALGGEYDMRSILDDLPEEPPKPSDSSTIYWRDWRLNTPYK